MTPLPFIRARDGENIGTALHSEWVRIGGGFANASAATRVDLEHLIVNTARRSHRDPRLFWVMLAWLDVHEALLNRRRLARLLDAALPVAREQPDAALTSATCGVLFGILAERSPSGAKPWRALQDHCAPLQEHRAMFDVIASNPVLNMIAREDCLPVFREWGFWHNEITDSRDAIRSLSGVLRGAPELASRAVLGADLAGDVINVLATQSATISDLARATGATRAAVHETVNTLVARGFVVKPNDGYRRPLTLAAGIADWIRSFPLARTPA